MAGPARLPTSPRPGTPSGAARTSPCATREAERINQALIQAGVVGDYRTPDRLRLGPAPVTTRFTDVWDALDILRRVIEDQDAAARSAHHRMVPRHNAMPPLSRGHRR